MKLRECVMTAAIFINLGEEQELLSSKNVDFGDCQKSIDFLVKCANRVVCEIADAYLKLRHREEIETDEKGAIGYDRFLMPPAHILSAKKGNDRVCFKEFPDRLETNERGKIVLEYAYLPRNLELDDELPFRDGNPDGRIIAYGIAAEFYLINGQSDEAVVWDKRYRDGLHNAQLRRREARVRERFWM